MRGGKCFLFVTQNQKKKKRLRVGVKFLEKKKGGRKRTFLAIQARRSPLFFATGP